MNPDQLLAVCWVLLGLLSLLSGGGQRQARHYFPAYVLLGLAIGTPVAFYVGLLIPFEGDATAVRMWAVEHRASLYLYPVQIAMVAWSLYLVARVNLAKPGSRVDFLGRRRPPNRQMVDHAIAVLVRGKRHGVLNEVTAQWLAEDVEWRHILRLADKRLGPHGRGTTAGDRIRLLWRILVRRWYRRLAVRLAGHRRGRASPRRTDD